MGLETRWWQAKPGKEGTAEVVCGLCHHNCTIPEGKAGYCRVRRNEGGVLVSPYLGRFTSVAVDPIEKKPLAYWKQGTFIFSLGSLGCTMRCPFCQNHSIAQFTRELPLTGLSPQELVAKVKELRLPSVAYTYNEPLLQAEYILETAPLLKAEGVATVLVTNGMASEKAIKDIAPHINAVNIDFKAFTPKAYASMGGSLDRVKGTVEFLVKAGIHVELTTLVVPGVSDSTEGFALTMDWVASLSPLIPVHISRYFPAYKFTTPSTSLDLLERFADIARARVKHARIGNVGHR